MNFKSELSLLSRDEFKKSCLARDNNSCIICGSKKNITVHHLIERKLFKEDFEFGGYFIDNGVSICEEHHLDAEYLKISAEELREKAGIKNLILPSHFNKDFKYDKWGNKLIGNEIIPGELFEDDAFKKVLKSNKNLINRIQWSYLQ
jgi:hypothetical protein